MLISKYWHVIRLVQVSSGVCHDYALLGFASLNAKFNKHLFYKLNNSALGHANKLLSLPVSLGCVECFC